MSVDLTPRPAPKEKTYAAVLRGGPDTYPLFDPLRRQLTIAWPKVPPEYLHVDTLDDQALRDLCQPKAPDSTTHLTVPIVKHVYRVGHIDYVYEYVGEQRDGRYVP